MKIITSDRIAEATVGSFENRSDDAEFPFPFPSFPTTFGSSQAVKQKEGKKMEMTMEQVVLTLASAASVLLLLLAANRWISVCVQCTHALTHSLTDGVCVLGSISRRRRRWRRWKRKMERKTNRSQNTHTHTAQTLTDWDDTKVEGTKNGGKRKERRAPIHTWSQLGSKMKAKQRKKFDSLQSELLPSLSLSLFGQA